MSGETVTPKDAPGSQEKQIVPDSRIGLSLSNCIRDLVIGKIDEQELSHIISGTAVDPDDPISLDRLIQDYRKNYWYNNPDKAEALCRKLFQEGRVVQPRREGKSVHSIAFGHWIDKDRLEQWERLQETYEREGETEEIKRLEREVFGPRE